MNSLNFIVSQESKGLRLDQAIAANSELSRGMSRKIIDVGGCYRNRKRTRRSSAEVQPGDKIAIYWRDEEIERLKKIDLSLKTESIIYEDSHFLVINKPTGLPSQGTRTQDIFHVVPQIEKLFLQMKRKCPQLRIIHRLDRDTTGVMVLGKNKKAYQHISDAFSKRKVEKEYHAICYGLPKESKWTQKEPLGKIQASAGRVYVDFDKGLDAETHFSTLSKNDEEQISLVKCQPITGRTHQIRAHLDFQNLPVVGDRNYGKDCFAGLTEELKDIVQRRQFLHARALAIPRLRGEGLLHFNAPYPEAMHEMLNTLDIKDDC